ncbi:MAG: GTP-binding protein [Phycisphaera sp.]|nr:GTP-binding protein [Phycisphaera sp.]
MNDVGIRAWLASPSGRAGIAIIDLQGDVRSIDSVLAAVAPGPTVARGKASHRRLGEVDDGLVLRLDPTHAQLMPHGGIAIVRRLAEVLASTGCEWLDSPPDGARFEASDRFEALALDTLSHAASPAALAPLLRQAEAWRRDEGPLDDADRLRGRRLDRLVAPVTIACVGAPNAGKSSLLNALAAVDAAIVADRPGTTRDRVSRRLDLGGVVVEWIDTPGLRETDDPIELAAIQASLAAIRTATLVVRLRAPDVADPRLPDDLAPAEGILDVRSKSDLRPARGTDIGVSARTGEGIVELARAVRSRIVREEDLSSTGRWAFHEELRSYGTP